MGEQFCQLPIKIVVDASLETNENRNTKAENESPNSDSSILTKLHAGYFRICVSLGAQAMLWKTLSEHTDKSQVFHYAFRMLPSTAFLLLWWLAFGTLTVVSCLYILRCIFKFKMVKAEFSNHIGVNYLFSPWISWLLLLSSAPFPLPKTLPYQTLWWVFVAPVVVLDVKVYGQWFTTEKRFFSMFANPTSQMSVIGNLVGAWAAAAMMRPVFFLFVAAPSIGSLAWNSISGGFDTPCKMLFFLSLFLFTSLACRPALFKKSMRKFTVAWWAYSFPLTFLALASTEYAQQVRSVVVAGLSLVLSAFSVLIFLTLLVFTALNTDKLLHEDDPSLRFHDDLATKPKSVNGRKKISGPKEALPS